MDTFGCVVDTAWLVVGAAMDFLGVCWWTILATIAVSGGRTWDRKMGGVAPCVFCSY